MSLDVMCSFASGWVDWRSRNATLTRMTEKEFRAMALSLPGAVEASHMDHPDFRVGGKVFATVRYPRPGWGMVALTPDEQSLVVQAEPDVFSPAAGAWGR